MKVTNEKAQLISGKESVADSTVNSTWVSQPVPTKNDVNGSNVEAEARATAEVSCEVGTFVAVHKDVQSADAGVGDVVSHDPEKIREEQAAIKAQAAFRGYLVSFLLLEQSYFDCSNSNKLHSFWLVLLSYIGYNFLC